jgi:hypothetical protein
VNHNFKEYRNYSLTALGLGGAKQRQGEIVTTKDPNETVHEYVRDNMGRVRHDCIIAFGTGVDETVKRISTAYEPKRPSLVAQITSHDHAEPGQGTVLNDVARKYDAFWQQTQDTQAHDGPADGSTPKVEYAYADGSSGNSARRQTMTYPNGRQINLGYGAADSIEDLFSLVKTVGIEGEGERIAYTRVGLGRFVEITYQQPAVRMSMIRPDGGSEGEHCLANAAVLGRKTTKQRR